MTETGVTRGRKKLSRWAIFSRAFRIPIRLIGSLSLRMTARRASASGTLETEFIPIPGRKTDSKKLKESATSMRW